jgi:hypothetical protein
MLGIQALAPGVIRTHSLLIRSQMLYPIELRVRLKGGKGSVMRENVKVGRGYGRQNTEYGRRQSRPGALALLSYGPPVSCILYSVSRLLYLSTPWQREPVSDSGRRKSHISPAYHH